MSDPVIVPGIDAPRVSRWLADNVGGVTPPFDFSLIAGGRSNLTYKVIDAADAAFVLRRPPLGHVLATAHDMGREHRIIAALGPTAVPVAPALGYCPDPEVNGAPFYVMGFVDGLVLDSPPAGRAIPEAHRRLASESLADILVALHAIEPGDVGLGDLGKREGYVERQLRRWSTQWQSSKTRELPVMEEVHHRLAARIPVQQGSGIAHGDYRLGNCLVSRGDGSVIAVLDWELCTLGDVLADVGYMLMHWTDPDEDAVFAANDPSGAPGFLTRRQMIDRYETGSGRQVANLGYYVAFQCWRLAAIAEGVRARYMAGVMGVADDAAEVTGGQQEDRVADLANRALAELEKD